jgi:uncharacterized membrane protein
MSETAGTAGWVGAILDRARDKSIRQQVLSQRISSELARWLPTLLSEYLKALMGSLLGLWVITAVLTYTVHAVSIYTLAAFGLLYSIQVTYYKHRLAVDPDFKIPKCRCGGRQYDEAEKVLRSAESAIARIPSSLLGVALYVALPILVYTGGSPIALPVAFLSVLCSAYLGYVMIVRIRGLCINCISVTAVNLLMLWQLWR